MAQLVGKFLRSGMSSNRFLPWPNHPNGLNDLNGLNGLNDCSISGIAPWENSRSP